MGFKNILQEHLKDKFDKESLELLPRGYQTIGKIIIIKLKEELMKHKEMIGKAYLELNPHMDSVYINTGIIEGEFRKPEGIEFLVGKDDPIVEHKEHGITYRFDITKIMFSKGNLNERKKLASFVNEGEIIVDMFAGIGYFSLPIAHLSRAKKIFSIELNPVAFDFLTQNIKINHFEEKIIPIEGDSKEETIKLSKEGIRADRIVMGVFPAPREFIPSALSLVKNDGTVIHYEGVRDEEKIMNLFEEFTEDANKEGFITELLSKRLVKSYGPRLFHVVLDILVKPKP